MPVKRSRLGPAAVFLAAAMLAVATFAPADAASRYAVPVVGTLGLVLTAVLVRLQGDPTDRSFLMGLLFSAVAVRLFLFAAVNMTVGPYVFAPDAFTYEIVGEQLRESWAGLRAPPAGVTDTLQVGYVYMNAALFRIFGRAPAAPAVVNLFLGAWVAVPVYHLTRSVCRGHRGVAAWAAGLTAFFPSLMLWSVLNIREAPTILLLTTAVFFAARFQLEGRPWDLVGFVIPLLVVALFREYLMVLVAFSAAAGVAMGRSHAPLRALLGGGFLIMLGTLALQGAGIGGSLMAEPSLERVQYLRRDLALGAGSAYGAGADVSSVEGALRFLPVGIAYFLLAPFPWSVTSVLQSITLPESLLWYGLVLFGLRGIWLVLRHDPRAYTVVLMVLMTVTFSYALVEGNVGTAYRHRAQILPLAFVIIAVGIQDVRAGLLERRLARSRAHRRAVQPGRAGSPSEPARSLG